MYMLIIMAMTCQFSSCSCFNRIHISRIYYFDFVFSKPIM